VNVDATNLYLGGYGMSIGGSNNVVILFLGMDTLTDNAWTLWHKTGKPNALDFLHNVRFTEPMDVAIILGDTYGDGPAYTNFDLGGPGGYNFGQGIWYTGTNSTSFWPMADAKLSQFHGEGTTPCETGGSSTNRRTRRWEAALPWGALNAAGPGSVSNLFILRGDRLVQRTDQRPLSVADLSGRPRLGAARRLRAVRVQHDLSAPAAREPAACGPAWRRPVQRMAAGILRHAGRAGRRRGQRRRRPGQPRRGDRGDASPERGLAVCAGGRRAGRGFAVHWPFASGRAYDVYGTTNMAAAFQFMQTITGTNRYQPGGGWFLSRSASANRASA
jgi:hypothetical protein